MLNLMYICEIRRATVLSAFFDILKLTNYSGELL